MRADGGVRIVSGFSGATATGVTLAPGSGSWSSLSDRSVKANFASVDQAELLKRLAAMPVSTWNYRAQSPAVRHIGPTAQDFSAAFGVGEDSRHISVVDAQGVALAAVQGLYAMMKEKDAEVAELHARIDALEHQAAIQAGIRSAGLTGTCAAGTSGL